jgi:hypothetical protein
MAHTMRLDISDLPTIYNISSGVGPGRANGFEDTWVVQRLIKMANFSLFSGGVPVSGSGSIKVDGIAGDETLRMIRAFQDDETRNRRLISRDGGVDPAAKEGFTGTGMLFTIVHLNRAAKKRDEGAYVNIPFDPTTPATVRAQLARGAARPPRPAPRPFGT